MFYKVYTRLIQGVYRVYSVFSLTWPASMQIYWNKKRVYIRKEFNSLRTGLGRKHGRRFIVLGHKFGRRDVMWKHTIFIRIYRILYGKCRRTVLFTHELLTYQKSNEWDFWYKNERIYTVETVLSTWYCFCYIHTEAFITLAAFLFKIFPTC